MACPSNIGKCKDDVAAWCEHEERCNTDNKQKKDDCIKAEEKESCDEKWWDDYEKNCDTKKGTLEEKDRCSNVLDSSKCKSTSTECDYGPTCSK
jgi:hypothetical protein